MDQLKCMQVFTKVVELGAFVAAAEALEMSPPMASKHVKRLEDRLGVRLLNRTTRTVSTTEAGRTFYQHCQLIFGQIEEAIAEASNLQLEPKGQLKINAPLSFGRVHLSRAVAAFQGCYPQISVDLTLNDRIVDIVDEGFDVAIRIGRLADSSLIARTLAPCRMTLCAAPAYIGERGKPRTPADLKHHNCLMYEYLEQTGRWRFSHASDEIVSHVNGDFRSSYGAAIVEAAVAGRGIILEPSFMTGPYLRSGELLQLLPDYRPQSLAVHAVYSQARLLPRKVRVFIDFLAQQFGPAPYWDEGLFDD